MADRYFSESPITGHRAELIGPEAHHLAHVMRARPGTQVTLFDGQGSEFSAQITKLGRSTIELDILGQQTASRELDSEVTLAVALPKGDRQRWLVEKLTELGAVRMVPLVTHRGVAQPWAGALAKLRRAVIEASKQCGRNRLMEIAEPHTWNEFATASRPTEAALNLGPALAEPVAHDSCHSSPLDPRFSIPASPAAHDASLDPLPLISHPSLPALRWIAHPAGNHQASSLRELLAALQTNRTPSIEFAVGPEGGFTDDELAIAIGTGWRTVDLGRRILRVETAAVALMAMAAGQDLGQG